MVRKFIGTCMDIEHRYSLFCVEESKEKPYWTSFMIDNWKRCLIEYNFSKNSALFQLRMIVR